MVLGSIAIHFQHDGSAIAIAIVIVIAIASAIATVGPLSQLAKVKVQSLGVWLRLTLGSIAIDFQHDGSANAIATATVGSSSLVVGIQSLGAWLRLTLGPIAIHFQYACSAGLIQSLDAGLVLDSIATGCRHPGLAPC